VRKARFVKKFSFTGLEAVIPAFLSDVLALMEMGCLGIGWFTT
jgi:hypothetical protein